MNAYQVSWTNQHIMGVKHAFVFAESFAEAESKFKASNKDEIISIERLGKGIV